MRKRRIWKDRKERIDKISDEMDKVIDSYFTTTEQMKEYLSFMSKFYNYS